jgi:ribose 1,5-bisphosphokinase PhnN
MASVVRLDAGASRRGKRLLVVDGAPGAGKSTLLRYVDGAYDSRVARFLPKYRTGGRPLRPGEFAADQRRIDEMDFARHAAAADFYRYTFGADSYGFHGADLDALIASCETTLVIVRSTRVIRELQCDVANAIVVPVLLDADPELVRARVGAEGQTDEVTRRRLARAAEMVTDFDPTVYTERLVNNGNVNEFNYAIDELLKPSAIAA